MSQPQRDFRIGGIRVLGAAVAMLALGLTTPAAAKKAKPIRETNVAVFPFKVLNPVPRYQHFGEGTSEAVINHMVRSKALKIAEEAQLDKAMKALSRNQMGFFDEDNALHIGKLVDARFIVIGSVDVLADQVALNARVLEVETRQVLVAERVHGPLAGAFNLYDQLAVRVTRAITQHLTDRLMSRHGDDADAADVARLLKTAKKFDPRFGGKDLAKALSYYKKAVLRDPNHATTRFALGQAMVQAGNFREGKYNLERSIEVDRAHVPSLTLLGFIADKQGEPKAGRKWYRRALNADENYALANFYMAANLLNAGEPREARRFARRAVKLGEKKAKPLLKTIDSRLARKRE